MDTESVTTAPFTLTNVQVGLIVTELYLRMFWWMIVPVPLFGLLAMAFGPAWIKGFAWLCLLWPLVLPARARLVSMNLAKYVRIPTIFSVTPQAFQFYHDAQDGFFMQRSRVRSALILQNHLVFLTKSFKTSIPVPVNAFSDPADATHLVEAYKR